MNSCYTILDYCYVIVSEQKYINIYVCVCVYLYI